MKAERKLTEISAFKEKVDSLMANVQEQVENLKKLVSDNVLSKDNAEGLLTLSKEDEYLSKF